jgi:hypothetical protein
MSEDISNEEVDRLVLEALRRIARDDIKGRVEGRNVRQAAPKAGLCVYARIEDELERTGVDVELVSSDPLIQFKTLLDSMTRLKRADLLFENGTGTIQRRTFWVVMD